jgi:hypothetical protein
MDIEIDAAFFPEDFIAKLNPVLPEGILVKDALRVVIPSGGKKHAVPALLWGYSYIGLDGAEALVPAKEEKRYRQSQMNNEIGPGQAASASAGRIFGLRRKSVLAQTPGNPQESASYFSVYTSLYQLG